MKWLGWMLTLLLAFSSPMEEVREPFLEGIHQAYETYKISTTETNDFYLEVVQGILDGEVRYGIFFFSYRANDYNVEATLNQQERYVFPTNNRGDVAIVALNLSSNQDYQIVVIDQSGNVQTLVEPVFFASISENQFLQQEGLITGQGEGARLERLQSVGAELTSSLFYISAISIVLVCGLVLLFYRKMKKGMFAEEARTEGVFDFKAFLEKEFEEVPSQEELSLGTPMDAQRKEAYLESGTIPPIYKRYGRGEEDELSDFDIGNYLREMGYITDYAAITEDEKNSIMLELMKLRDTKKITKDDYLLETGKLWKK